jgi:hypothetical protein
VTDQVGKAFLVLRGARMCVVCDRVFTREEAAPISEQRTNSDSATDPGGW